MECENTLQIRIIIENHGVRSPMGARWDQKHDIVLFEADPDRRLILQFNPVRG